MKYHFGPFHHTKSWRIYPGEDFDMSNKISLLTFLVPLLFLSGCNKIELYYAEKAYSEAIHTQEFKPVLTVLKKLAVLQPQNYKSKLEAAEVAIIQFEDAHKYLEKGDYYLAYIASHDSYRTIPTKLGKKILLKRGEKLSYVTDAQLDIAKSFDSLPKAILTITEKYQQQPVLEWDLIEVNTIFIIT